MTWDISEKLELFTRTIFCFLRQLGIWLSDLNLDEHLIFTPKSCASHPVHLNDSFFFMIMFFFPPYHHLLSSSTSSQPTPCPPDERAAP